MKRSIALLTSIVTAASCAFAFSSCGDDRLYMPDLSGIDYTKATEQFDFLELTISAEAQSGTVIKGKIMEQSIRPGAKISSGQNVLITISSGNDAPHVYKDGVDTGQTEAVTTTAVTEAESASETTTGTEATTLGADQFVMPNFRGMLLSEAVEKHSDDISFQIKEYVEDSDLKPGQIVRQDITEGTTCDKGSTLYVTIASGKFEGGRLEQQTTTQPMTDAYGNPITAMDPNAANGYDPNAAYGYDPNAANGYDPNAANGYDPNAAYGGGNVNGGGDLPYGNPYDYGNNSGQDTYDGSYGNGYDDSNNYGW